MPPAGASRDVLRKKRPGAARSCVGLRSRGLRRRLCPRRAVRSCARLRERQETYCEKNAREPCGHVSAAKPGTAEAALSAWGGAELRPPAGASGDVLWRKKPAGGARSCVGLRSRGLRRRLCPRGAVRSCARLRERQETYCGDTPVRRSGRTAQKAEPAEDSCPYAYFFEKTLDKPEKCRYNRTVNQRQQVFVKA